MNEIIITFPIVQRAGLTDEMIVSQLQLQIMQLINLGALEGNMDDFLKDFEIQRDSNMIAVTVDESAIGKRTDNFLTVGAGMNRKVEIPQEFLVTELKEEPQPFDRSFSVVQIVDRMKNAMRQPRQRFRMMILDYKRYYKMAKKSLISNEEKAKKFREMFITDLMGMITEILPLIEEGKMLATIIGTSQVTPELNQSARDLSIAYRRALKQEKGMGLVGKTQWNNLKKAYSEFVNILMKNLFPELAEAKEETTGHSRRYSETKDGRVKIFVNPEELNPEHEAEAEVRLEELQARKEELDHTEEESQKEYSKTSDGRIKLF